MSPGRPLHDVLQGVYISPHIIHSMPFEELRYELIKRLLLFFSGKQLSVAGKFLVYFVSHGADTLRLGIPLRHKVITLPDFADV